MQKLKFIIIILTIFAGLGSFNPLMLVNAQSQSDVTVCRFDASSQENFYIQLNYTCKNIPWLPRAYTTYRRIDKDSIQCVSQDETAYRNLDFLDPATGDSIKDESAPNSEPYFVEDYMLFYTGDASEPRETVTWLEHEISLEPSVTPTFNDKALSERKLPRPFLASEELVNTLKNNNDLQVDAERDLNALKGSIVCPVYAIGAGGVYDIDNGPKGFVKADLIPPTLQNLENVFVEVFYIIWGLVFVFGLVSLTFIGFQFMYGGTSPERLGELRSKLILWMFGLLLIFLAPSAIRFIYALAGINTTECYRSSKKGADDELLYDLTLPGFTFFFSDVCTDTSEG